jgi:hypothetical protein
MDKRTSVIVGGSLILLGVASLIFTSLLSLLGLDVARFMLRFWPGIISVAGLLFVAPPLLIRGKRGLGGLFIPGVPILVTGGILLVASVLDAWPIWSWLWPMEVVAVALGLALAAIYMRVLGLIIPAIIVGINGLVFQFCALTGLWSWWSVLWTIEPLSVGLALLLVGIRKSSRGLLKAAMILCAVAAAGFLLMVTILAGGWLIRLVGPGLIVLAGVLVLLWGLARGRLLPRSAVE